jgi:GTP-binding protein
MHFIDECSLQLEAGDGGDGAIAFRREKYVPFGGPSGGDGGRGGDIVFVADEGLNTLQDLIHLRKLRADSGQNGGGKDMYGRSGSDRDVRVPPGTIVYDYATSERLTELVKHGERKIIARGGKGGRGNKHFATPTERAPRRAEPGGKGESKHVRLELKVMADVGLLGFPNVGKSTFIRAVSRARPKVANYPFTTLTPHLGVATIGDGATGLGRSFVLADIPGLIPGASQGAGLGTRFLRHIERTRVLLHLVTLDEDEGREPVADYHVIREELTKFATANGKQDLLRRPEVVVLTKSDLPDVRAAYPELKQKFAELGLELRLVSAATHQGLNDLLYELAEKLLL